MQVKIELNLEDLKQILEKYVDEEFPDMSLTDVIPVISNTGRDCNSFELEKIVLNVKIL